MSILLQVANILEQKSKSVRGTGEKRLPKLTVCSNKGLVVGSDQQQFTTTSSITDLKYVNPDKHLFYSILS